jgi:O-acetyl-ADP-ribose deacetylase (regulator of RNase III)
MLADQKVMNTVLRAIHADITTLAIDAIVNTANLGLAVATLLV